MQELTSLFSVGLNVGGFIPIGAVWKVLYQAQRTQQVATTGPYASLRHPQYTGYILIMPGLLVQWPTLITLVMFPIQVTMYIRLATHEERETMAQFGQGYLISSEDTNFPAPPDTVLH